MFLTRLFARVRKILSGSRLKLHDSKTEGTTALKMTARVDGDREFKSDRNTLSGICGGGGPEHRRPVLPTVICQLIGFAHAPRGFAPRFPR
jgi:hypothetical protein